MTLETCDGERRWSRIRGLEMRWVEMEVVQLPQHRQLLMFELFTTQVAR